MEIVEKLIFKYNDRKCRVKLEGGKKGRKGKNSKTQKKQKTKNNRPVFNDKIVPV